MSRSGVRVKVTTRDSAPTLVVGVGAESSPAPWDTADRRVPYILDRLSLSWSRRTPQGWTPHRSVTCGGWRDAWDALDALGASGRRVYVVAPRASDLLTLMHFWDRVQLGEVSIWDEVARRRRDGRADSGERSRQRHPLVMSGRPDVVGYSIGRASFRWVSVTNWCDMGMVDLFRSVGIEVPADADPLSKWEYHQWPAASVSEAVLRYTKRLMGWWLASGCGTWRDTPGQASWSSFLRRGGAGQIVQHSDGRANVLESQAAFGGRASAFYFGAVGHPDRWSELADAPAPSRHGMGMSGPVHRFDVRAMYPSVLRDNPMPVRLIRTERDLSVGSLRSGLSVMLALARVRITTRRAIYPLRVGDTVAYPTGTFWATLATPELRQAVDADEVDMVSSVAWYTPGTAFAGWAAWVMSLRDRMREAGDKVGEKMVKLLANSLTGRLAKRSTGWKDRPSAIPVEWWGTWPRLDSQTGEVVVYRSIAGHVQTMVRGEHRPPTLAAVYAHITSHGRARMNEVRELVGPRHCLWQDTDGVIVTDTGRDRILRSPHYHPTEYGRLRHEETFDNMQILTPKHYWRDGQWTLAGVHSGFRVEGGNTAHDVVTLNPVRSAVSPDASAVFRSMRHIDLTAIEPGVEVGHDGWAIPPAVGLAEDRAIRRTGQGTLEFEE